VCESLAVADANWISTNCAAQSQVSQTRDQFIKATDTGALASCDADGCSGEYCNECVTGQAKGMAIPLCAWSFDGASCVSADTMGTGTYTTYNSPSNCAEPCSMRQNCGDCVGTPAGDVVGTKRCEWCNDACQDQPATATAACIQGNTLADADNCPVPPQANSGSELAVGVATAAAAAGAALA
jgi:hypothetical protein